MQWYKDPKTVSAYAGLIASVTAMVVSIAALRKKPDDTNINNNMNGMYKVLVEAVERLSDESEQNRSDLVRFRKYVDDYIKAQNSVSVVSEPPPHIDSARPIIQVNPPKQVVSYNQIDAGLNSIAMATTTTSPLEYDIHVDVNKKSAPPVQLSREWKASK